MKGRTTSLRWFVLGMVAVAPLGSVRAAEPICEHRNPRKHLVLDKRLIAQAEGVRLVPGRVDKDPHNPLFQADKPWENALNNLYPNVIYDAEEKVFKLWYKCVLSDKDAIAKLMPPATVHDVGWLLLYATSKDGVTWQKPELGLIGFDGSTRNNAVCRDCPNVGVFKDLHDRDPARRYKMIYDVGRGNMRVRFSADGLRWSEPITPKGLGPTGDTHNNAFWDESLGKYVLMTRLYLGERLVARSQSGDFLDWESPALVLRSTPEEGKSHQTYCMPAFPYASGYVGFVMMYHAGTDRTVDCELCWSPDSVRWERVFPGKAFVPRGPAGSYDAGCIYAQAGTLVVQDGRILLFYGGSTVVHRGWKRHCLPCLARLRIDGFAAYEPAQAERPGTLVTQPMVASGEPLRVTADAAGGALRVEVLDAPGYTLADCQPLTADATDAAVQWKAGKDFSALKGKSVRLKIELTRAKLYAVSGLQ